MNIIGISAFYHDSAAALVTNGKIIAAAQEERFTRIKNDASFPKNALEFCLRFAGINASEIDYVCFYEKPLLKFDRIIKSFIETSPHYFKNFEVAMKEWVPKKLFHKNLLAEELRSSIGGDWRKKILFSDHHLSHSASAFFPSPFESAAILTIDGVGEWNTTTLGIGHSNHLDIIKEIKFPHSVGLLYAAFTNYLGFKVNSGEYKMMGLAPYGTPRFANVILENIVDVKTDGSFAINLDFFDYPTGRRMTNEKFHSLFGRVPRKPESNLTQLDMDIAASIQKVTEIIITRLVRSAASTTGAENLCLAGGVALNCVANGKIVKDGYFKNIWIQPAAGDAGGSVGAALAAWHIAFGHKRKISQAIDGMSGAYLGQEFNSLEIKSDLKNSGAVFEFLEDNELIRKTASLLSEGRVVGWFQGRAEFGPRSLGNRSILADPRSKNMQKNLNLKIKFRESFRPFAPSVLREDLEDWFDLGSDSPYMLIVSNVLDKHLVFNNIDTKNLSGIEKLNIVRSVVPAVTHLDNSARVQTIHSQTNPKFHSLISEFKKITGCPVIVNTSFNVRSEPIVNTPQEAYRCFMGTDIDVLVVGNYLMQKTKQPSELAKNYASSFVLD